VDAEKNRDEELYQTQLQQFRQVSLSTDEQKQEISSIEAELEDDGSSFDAEASVEEPKLDVVDNQQIQEETEITNNKVTIVVSYENKPYKYQVKDFGNYFVTRYRFLESLLRGRQELRQTMAINRLFGKNEKENVAIIGIVQDRRETKNGNLMITIEDPTASMKVLVTKSRKDIYDAAKDLVVDEVVGINGVYGDKIIFADNIVWPDIPITNDLKKGNEEEYVIFLSDLHIGSKLFMKEEFDKFLRWIRQEAGSDEQRDIASKVKYIIIAGDLVDGVGVYPSQQEELEIDDIYEQYREFVKLISKVPKHIQIIACPGNHDMVHLAEPQPAFYQEFAPELFELPNLSLVTNPSLVNIGKTEDFEGFNILIYHGYSFDYYVANVESIRMEGGYHRSDLIMKFLLKRRHLAPSFGSTPYHPSHQEDPLLIKTIPDFLITGHIHYSKVANYKGVTMISGSCWQATTSFQEKMGHKPEPARVPIVNLKNREVKILRFG
jgi:DNA polymerase II small subunit